MTKYVILGTSHQIQESRDFLTAVTGAIQRYTIRRVAEEFPFDNPSKVCGATKHWHIPYLQIDLFPEEWAAHGIDHEMKLRDQYLQGQDVRLSNADSVRENFWLEKIEASLDCGSALVICGYLHVNFLAQKVEERGGTVLDKGTFPAELLHRKPEMVLDPAGLEDYLRKFRAGSPYSESGSA